MNFLYKSLAASEGLEDFMEFLAPPPPPFRFVCLFA